MRGLTIIVAEASPERFRAALTVAAAQAALGARARIFMQADAVGLLKPPIASAADEAHEKAGLPGLAVLLDEALGFGIELIVCQSGMLLCNIEARDLDARMSYGGLVSLMQSLENDRLLAL